MNTDAQSNKSAAYCEESRAADSGEVEITIEDHEAKFKDVEVTLRTGAKMTIRVQALPFRKAAAAAKACKNGEFWPVLEQSLPADQPLDDIERRVMLRDGEKLLDVALALAFGMEWKKKLRAVMQNQTDTKDAERS